MQKTSKNYQTILNDLALYLQAIGYQKSSQKSIKQGVKRFFVWLQDKGIYHLSAVKRTTIKSYHKHLETRPNELFEGGLSSKMIRDYLWMVSLLFKLLEKQKRIDKNPISGYQLPKVINTQRAILSLAEIKELYNQCESLKERCILHVYYGLGLRRSEGEALNVSDIDYKNGWLYVRKGKGGKGRNMPLTPSIKNDLKNYAFNERPKGQEIALILNERNSRLRGQSALIILRKLLKKAHVEKKIDLHCLRHSIATHLIRQGMPLEQVRTYLGHSHLESTQRYIRYDSKRLFIQQLHPIDSKEL
jgi:integrase/recombinase XerD